MIKKNKKLIITVFILISCILSFCLTTFNIYYAQSVKLDSYNAYSNVFDDLKKDTSFNSDNYITDVDNYTIEVLQIAESSNGELFIYTYQPSGASENIVATSINISRTIYENLHYENYSLVLLNSYNVFYKYKVENFDVLEDLIRYYDISSIMRNFIDGIDKASGNDNTISEIGIAVAKRFTACTVDGNVSYTNTETEVVTITDKFNTTLRYTDGYWLAIWDKTDRHIVSFSTDWNIEKLYEVDISFVTKDYTITEVSILPFDLLNLQVAKTYSNEQNHNLKINSSQHTSNNANGLLGFKHSWNRIEKSSDFIANNNDLSETTINNVKSKDWVLSFYETEWKKYDHIAVPTYWGVEVSDVMILRLKFETNGVVYNLGVVDTKQTSSGVLGNLQDTQSFTGLIRIVLVMLLLVLVIVVLSPLLPAVFNVLFAIIKFIFKLVINIISLPFNLFKKRK